MGANYVRNIARFDAPAAVQMFSVFFNGAAQAAFVRDPQAKERCLDGLRAARVARTAQELSIGYHTMVFFPVFDEEERIEAVFGMTGTLHDLPRLTHLALKGMPFLSEVIHETPNVVLTARPSGEIDYVSNQWYAITGQVRREHTPQESLQRGILERDARAFSTAWKNGVLGMREFSHRMKIQTTSGPRTFELRARPVRRSAGTGIIKWVGTLTDVHDAVVAVENLGKLKTRFQILAEATDVVSSSRTLDDVAHGLTQLSSTAPAESWFIDLRDPESGLFARVNLDDAEASMVTEMLSRGDRWRFGAGGSNGTRARFVASQVSVEGDVVGLMGNKTETGQPPSEEDLRLVAEIAVRAGIAVERILSVSRDRELARMLQRSMLPLALPYAPGIVLDVAYEPAQKEALVGGDWYDAFELADGTIAVAIGDVAGHGFQAAIVMNQVRHAMQTAVLENPDPAFVLASANRLVLAHDRPMVTALFGILDPLTLTFSFASAGHLPPVVVEQNGGVRTLPSDGVPLGVADELRAATIVEDLPAGGALAMYTDGVVEDQRDLLLGERRLHETLSRWALRGFSARASDLQRTMRTGSHHDDAAMFVMRFPHVDEFAVRLPATPRNAQRMRLAARRFVSGSPFSRERAFDAVFAVAEAINNAVLHAYGTGGGDVRLEMKRESERLIMAVHDDGTWRTPESYDRLHGLGIIERLADKFAVVPGAGGTSVHIEMRFSAAPAVRMQEMARN